tara:strand:+ start:785 stop:1129 length:345 start_codon:yes stop_codon:yes gene_type:complete
MAATWDISNTEYVIKGSVYDKGEYVGDNQITTLHWSCEDKETVGNVDHKGRIIGSTVIPDTSGNFIEYSKVTKDDCLNWLKATLGKDSVKEIEDSVATQITLSKQPKIGSGVPW